MSSFDTKEDEVEDEMLQFSNDEEEFIWILSLDEKEFKSSLDEEGDDLKDGSVSFNRKSSAKKYCMEMKMVPQKFQKQAS